MSIPTIPGSARVEDQQIGVKRNLGAAEAPLAAARAAFQAAGEAVQEVAGAVSSYEENKRRAEEVAVFNQASIITRKTTSSFRDSLRNNPDDQQWVANWNKTAEETRWNLLSNPRLGKRAKIKLGQVLDSWQSETTSEFQTAADVAGSERRKRVGLLAVDEALKDGNEKAAVAAVDGLVSARDIWPEEAEKLKKQFPVTLAENEIQTMAVTNPYRAYQKIKEGGWPEIKDAKTRERLTAELNGRMNAVQSQNLQGLVDRVATDPDNPPRDEELEAKVKTGDITARGANSIRALVAHKNLADAKDRATVLEMRVHDHDFTVDDNPDKSARELRDEIAGLPLSIQKPIADELSNKLAAAKKHAASDERPAVAERNRMDQQEREQGLFLPWATVPAVHNRLWSDTPESKSRPQGIAAFKKMTDEDVENLYGKGTKRQDIIDREELEWARYKTQMRAYQKANPDATDEDLTRESQRLKQPHVMAAVASALGSGVSTPVEGQIYTDAQGNRARWQDGKWVDVK